MAENFFPGWEDFERVQVIECGGMKKLMLRGKLYMQWNVEDELTQKVAIAQLCNFGKASQEELAQAFGLHVNTVQKYAALFEMEGSVGLATQQSGPRSAWKLTPEVKFKILETALNNKDLSYEAMGKILEDRWNEKISINSIRQVLLENGFSREKKHTEEPKEQGGLF